MSFNFEKLDVYQKAIAFAEHVYRVTKDYPNEEMFGLASQFRRAAVSISLNIAEGSARTKRDFNRFLDMARGSVFECAAILQISEKCRHLHSTKSKRLQDQLTDLSKMLSGLKRSLTSTTNNEQRTMNNERGSMV
jgi:four helix bundle protein